ncbi:unnamed protein product [Musa acuminata subsp. burmannicoides]
MLHGLNSPNGKLILIEALVLLATVLLFLLIIFGSFRRRSSNTVIQAVVSVAYTCSTSLVFYTVGLMQSSGINNGLLAIWAICLSLVLGSAVSISAYRLEDNENWKKNFAENMMHLFIIGYLVGTYLGHTHSSFRIPVVVLLILTGIRVGERTDVFQGATKTNGQKKSKLIAAYMKYESELTPQDEPDPTNMRGYNYLVYGEDQVGLIFEAPNCLFRIEITDRQVITVNKIWRCTGSLLSSSGDPEGRLKDICLSFALFKLIQLRFSGYQLAESSLQKTRDFVIRGLLSNDDDAHERAFRVIEVELAFLHDYFYTKYPLIFVSEKFMLAMSATLLIFLCWSGVSVIKYYLSPTTYFNLITIGRKSFDAIFTLIIVVAIALLELFQILLYVCSEWTKVSLVCRYVAHPSWHDKPWITEMIKHLCHLKVFDRVLQNKLGQYSLLEHCDYKPTAKNMLYCMTCEMVGKTRAGQKQSKRLKLPREVKKAVVRWLRLNHDALPTNGISSLQRNGVSAQLSWACSFENHAQVILVWHIATSLCEIHGSRVEHAKVTSMEMKDNQVVANSLSQYCAYLVGFVPDLLPDNSFDVQLIFDDAVKEASSQLGTLNLDQRFQSMMNQSDTSQNVVCRGARLGKQLIDMETPEMRWKVMAEFWVEMILFLAPSDNAKAHAEGLARGGEFITHLWALLSHAGILGRGPSCIL